MFLLPQSLEQVDLHLESSAFPSTESKSHFFPGLMDLKLLVETDKLTEKHRRSEGLKIQPNYIWGNLRTRLLENVPLTWCGFPERLQITRKQTKSLILGSLCLNRLWFLETSCRHRYELPCRMHFYKKCAKSV